MEDQQLWERLLHEQAVLFRKTIQRNVDLEARVVELERELSVWKVALKSNDEEKTVLKKQVTRLERNFGSLRDDNPLVLCLIDGDGNIFSQDLISRGRAGGSQAAQLLTKGIIDYLIETEDHGKNEAATSISGRVQILVSVYYNKSGLQETLTNLQLCTIEQFEAFTMGFSQASPLFSFVDVGNGKEAADTKIKEFLRVFTRFPQMLKIFFGGGHDNGYASTLHSLNNEGLLDKIILLRGYHEVAIEVKMLHLPSVEFTSIFMTEKLPYYQQYKRNSNHLTIENEEWTPRTTNITNNLILSPRPKSKQPQPDPFTKCTQPIVSPCLAISSLSDPFSDDPRPCNFHYLAVCKSGTACRFGHDYELEPQDYATMRINAKKSPCGTVNKNKTCLFGDACPLGHVCPAGPNCRFHKVGKCKFLGNGMHDTFGGRMTTRNTPIRSDSPTSGYGGYEARSVTPMSTSFGETLEIAGSPGS